MTNSRVAESVSGRLKISSTKETRSLLFNVATGKFFRTQQKVDSIL